MYLLALGVGVGVMGGSLGLGGGVLMVPAFMAFGLLDTHTAKGTSLFIIIFVSALNAWQLNRGLAHKPWRLAAYMAAGSIVGGYASAWVTTLVSEAVILWIFIVLMAFLAARTFMIKPRAVHEEEVRQRRPISVLIGFLAGVAGGATGTGGGALLIPMALIAGIISNERAVGLSNLVMVCTSIAGSIAHLMAEPIVHTPWVVGHVNLALAPLVFFGAQLGSPYGLRLNAKMTLKHRREAMGVLLVLISLQLLYKVLTLASGE